MATVIIVGGGAAGFFTAITLARQAPQVQVVLLEAGAQFLGKVKISGGGRCNVTHHCFDPGQLIQHYPRGGKALRGAFARFQPRDVVQWFHAEGVTLKTEADGRMFPITDDSATIVDCLLQAARRSGVQLRAKFPVKAVQRTATGFQLEGKSGEVITGDRLILTTGSHPLGYQGAQSLGHTLIPPVPSLFTFTLKPTEPLPLTTLAGVSLPLVGVSLTPKFKGPLHYQGPVLITHWGLSGPAVLKLSAWGARVLYETKYHHPLWINWLPDWSSSQVGDRLEESKRTQARKYINNYCPFPLPQRFWQWVLTQVPISDGQRWADLSKTQHQTLISLLLSQNQTITAKGIFKEEFVTCGGIPLAEVDFKTMESRCCPGLYFAGEILDVDGVTGGFNFQNAWTTGWLAGQGCAVSLRGL